MRNLAFLFFVFFCSFKASAQFGAENIQAELRRFNDEHKDQVAASYFIDSLFYRPYGLVKKPSGSKRLLILEGSAARLLVGECIWMFKDQKQLDSFVTRFRPAFALNGVSIKTAKPIPGAKLIAVYRDGAAFKKWNDSLKQPQAGFYNFVFSVGNTAINIYLQTGKNMPLEIAELFAEEAARQLRKAQAKNGH